ncbi:hypothetical protein [Salarchaeum sp. JOR-1]|uniref:hypothetical protein n=1 Tax=Salarchaeum sp. JOR-1 TaxID=2599399 RepID=UPI001198769D|nr:hypothetical protein [Salarchaeum sp. JOR-1]QDX40683.1 hypothetical protein FQU85_07105 [Salarchaeum sp. JOR-1]
MAHEPQEAQAERPLTDRQSWAIIAVLVVSMLVIPGLILLGGTLSPLGLPWMDTLVALPMVPAVLFALVGVWTAVRR